MIDLLKRNETLRFMLYGILVSGMVIGIILAFISGRIRYALGGLIIGICGALAMAVHMAWAIETGVDMDEKNAVSFMRKHTVIRYLAACVILAIIGITDRVSPVTYVFGLLTVKTGAYMYPLFDRIANKRPAKTRAGRKLSDKETIKEGED